MKIGMLSGLWFTAESASVLASLQRIAALGFRYVDLHGVFHAGPAHLKADERLRVRSEMTTLGLQPRNYVLHAPCNVPSASEGELEQAFVYLREGIDTAVAWGINQVMLNAGQWAPGIRRAEAWSRAVRFLQRVCDYAKFRGVFIAQEAEPYVWFLVNDISSTARMLADVDRPNFVTLLDIGHMALAREGPAELARLSGTIIHVHLSDHQPYRHTNQVIGTGFVPYAGYLEALRNLEVDRQAHCFGYEEVVVSLELGIPGQESTDPDNWVRQSLAHLEVTTPFLLRA